MFPPGLVKGKVRSALLFYPVSTPAPTGERERQHGSWPATTSGKRMACHPASRRLHSKGVAAAAGLDPRESRHQSPRVYVMSDAPLNKNEPAPLSQGLRID